MSQKPTPLGLQQVSCRRNLPHQDCSRYNEVETYPTGTVVGIRLISWTLHQWSFIIPAIRSWLPPPAIHSFIYSFIYLFIYSFIHLFIYSFIHPFTCSCVHLFMTCTAETLQISWLSYNFDFTHKYKKIEKFDSILKVLLLLSSSVRIVIIEII